jgi:crossover junction endodeoxyribonuclease RuvC
MENIIGIDPGCNGSAVLIRADGSVDCVCFNKITQADISETLAEWREGETVFAYIENVHSMPKQGVASSFKFGVGFGFLQGVLVTLKIPFEFVTPQTWQKALSCQNKGDKNVTKQKAQQLFPNEKITHANADGLLIAEYGRRKRLQ